MSLKRVFSSDTLPLLPNESWSSIYGFNIVAVKEDVVGAHSVIYVMAFVPGTASRGKVWRVHPVTGEILSTFYTGWYTAGFTTVLYDPSGSGMYWVYNTPAMKFHQFDISTFATVPGGETVPLYHVDQDWVDEDDNPIIMSVGYSIIRDRDIIVARDNGLNQHTLGVYSISQHKRLYKIAVPVSANNYRQVSNMTKDSAFVMSVDGVIVPIDLTFGSKAGRSLSVGGFYVPPLSERGNVATARFVVCFDETYKRMHLFFPNPVSGGSTYQGPKGVSTAKVHSFTLTSSPRHVTKPIPLSMPRKNQRTKIASFLHCDGGRPCYDWPYTAEEVGDGTLTSTSFTGRSNKDGAVILNFNAGATGEYEQSVTVSVDHEENYYEV
jgi:hypothetical protein